MSAIEAIYQHGVFKPLTDVGLPENQRVRLSIQPLDPLTRKHGLAVSGSAISGSSRSGAVFRTARWTSPRTGGDG
jgi:predicted DNA-binding antitoxin AbrB/MazE fold protein